MPLSQEMGLKVEEDTLAKVNHVEIIDESNKHNCEEECNLVQSSCDVIKTFQAEATGEISAVGGKVKIFLSEELMKDLPTG